MEFLETVAVIALVVRVFGKDIMNLYNKYKNQ